MTSLSFLRVLIRKWSEFYLLRAENNLTLRFGSCSLLFRAIDVVRSEKKRLEGKPVDFVDICNALTFDILGVCSFSTDFGVRHFTSRCCSVAVGSVKHTKVRPY